MKLSKYAQIVKQDQTCMVYTGDGMWLGARAAMYRADGLPEVHGIEQAAAILSLSEKKLDQMLFREIDLREEPSELCRDDWTNEEMPAQDVEMQACKNGRTYKALVAEDGELLFYDERYLDPLADDFKDGNYKVLTVRRMGNGTPYIAVKNGLELLALVLPVQLLDENYMKTLSNFTALCAGQRIRERNRKNERMENEENDD